MRYAVGDVHGHRREVRTALAGRGLVDDSGDWAGGDAEVWFMGDLMDRGPDGAGVVEDVMRWQQQASDAGGVVASVLGNHEVLALGFRGLREALSYGATPAGESQGFAMSWSLNGGQLHDQDRLTPEMAAWMRQLPAIARIGDDVLMHADTMEYLKWGDAVDSINQAIATALSGDDLEAGWRLWASMTTRYAFVADDGPDRARTMLDALGGQRIVHGHSIIGDLIGREPAEVTEAWAYAGGLVLAVDGGIYAGGPSLVVPLD